MNDTNTLDATEAVANVERNLAQQYAKREVEHRHPADGVVVITYIVIGGK